MPATSPSAYLARPVDVVISAASPRFFMLPSSTITAGTSDQLRVPRSVRVLMPVVA